VKSDQKQAKEVAVNQLTQCLEEQLTEGNYQKKDP